VHVLVILDERHLFVVWHYAQVLPAWIAPAANRQSLSVQSVRLTRAALDRHA